MLRQAKVRLTLSALAVSVCCSPPLNANSNEPYDVKTICEAVKQPIDEVGMKVALAADFTSDGYEYSFFYDKTCPTIGVGLYDAPNVIKDDIYEEFQNTPFDDPLAAPPRIHVKIYGTLRTFDGKYRFDAIKYIEVSK